MGLVDFIIALNGQTSDAPTPSDDTMWFISNAGSESNGGHSESDAVNVAGFLSKTISEGNTILFNRGETFQA